MSYDETPIAAVVSDLSRRTGRRFVCEDGLDEQVTITLKNCPWRDVADVIAKMARCEVVELDDGSFSFEGYGFTVLGFKDSPLRTVLWACGLLSGENVIATSDLNERVTIDYRECGTPHQKRHFLERALAEFAVHALKIGEITLVSRAQLGAPQPRAASTNPIRASFVAWSAPAAAWFSLLERVTKVHVTDIGSASIDLKVCAAPVDEVLAATLLASRVDAPRQALADLPRTELPTPAACRVEQGLQATVTDTEHALALIDGRIREVGDELEPGVRLKKIETFAVTIDDHGREIRIEKD